MTAMSENEIKALAEALAKAVSNLGGSGSFTGSTSTRSSRGTGGFSGGRGSNSRTDDTKKTGENIIESLDGMMTSATYAANKWKEQQRSMNRWKVGSALKDVTEDLVSALETLAKKTTKHSKDLADSYAKFIKDNKGDFKKQQAGHTGLLKYNKLLKQLHKQTTTKGSGHKGKHSDKEQDEILETKAALHDAVMELKKLGIEAKDIKTKFAANGNVSIANKTQAKELTNTTGTIIKENTHYAKDLERVHDDELDARQGMIESIVKFAKDFALVGFRVLDRFMEVVPSRLQNGLTETNFTDAALHGQSGIENNEWRNANRNAIKLMGDASSGYIDSMAGATGMLHQFGFFGKAAMEQLSKLNDIQMNSGIAPTAAGSDQVQTMIAKIVAMNGMNQEQATAMVQAAMTSNAYYATAYNKSEADRLKIAEFQADTLVKIARSSGFSADYAGKMLQDALNNRNKGAIERIKSSILSPIYMETMRSQFEASTGRKMTVRDVELERLDNIGTDVTGNAPLAKEIAEHRKIMSTVKQDANDRSVADLSNSPTNMASTIALVAPQAIAGHAGISITPDAASLAAKTNENTTGKAIASTDYDDLVKQSRSTLTSIEEFYQNAKTIMDGADKSPLGPVIDMFKGAITIALGLFIKNLAGKLLLRLAGAFVGEAAAAATGAAATGAAATGAAATGAAAVGAETAVAGAGIGASVLGGGATAAGAAGIASKLGTLGKFAKGGIASIAGAGLGMAGDYVKNSAPKDDTTILDRETAGATMSIAGKALGYAGTGAMLGTLVGPLGTVIGGAIGGVVGGAVGVYDNWDTISSNLNVLTGGAAKMSKANTDEGVTPKDTSIHINRNAEQNMTSGKTVDDNGDELPEDMQKDQLSLLTEIRDNTKLTVDKIIDNTANRSDIEQTKSIERQYNNQMRSGIEAVANQRASQMFGAQVQAAKSNIDSAASEFANAYSPA